MNTLQDIISNHILSDDSYKSGNDCERVIDNYHNANEETKAVIDDIFISLTGWCLITLISKYEGEKNDT